MRNCCLCSFSLTKLMSVNLVDRDLDKIISPQHLGALSVLQWEQGPPFTNRTHTCRLPAWLQCSVRSARSLVLDKGRLLLSWLKPFLYDFTSAGLILVCLSMTPFGDRRWAWGQSPLPPLAVLLRASYSASTLKVMPVHLREYFLPVFLLS